MSKEFPPLNFQSYNEGGRECIFAGSEWIVRDGRTTNDDTKGAAEKMYDHSLNS